MDDDWDQVACSVELTPTNSTPFLSPALISFSLVEVLFTFHPVPEHKIVFGARHPRDRKDLPLVNRLRPGPKKFVALTSSN